MACMKLGSKADAFRREGQAWFCTTGLPSDISVEVEDMTFHLHKFPLLSKSGVLEKLIREKSDEGEKNCVIQLSELPGGAKAFELVAKFCYGVKLELTASNVVYLRCAAEHLEMTDEIEEGNLIDQTEVFLNQIVLHNWKESIKALQTCDELLPYAEDLQIVKKCIESIAVKACTNPGSYGWPVMENGPMQSPEGSFLWNGINTGARLRDASSDWWYDDVSSLSFHIYKRLISAMESRSIRKEIIAGSLTYYAKRYLPGLNRRHNISETSTLVAPSSLTAAASEEQKHLIEEIDRLLPMNKGVISTKFLFRLLRIAMILRAAPSCMSNLERRIAMRLDQATLEDLLLPNVSYSTETLYDVDCIQHIIEHFLAMDQATGGNPSGLVDEEEFMGSPSSNPLTTVAKLIDRYLAEIAPDVNLKLPRFQTLAAAVPDYARPLDDGLYRAIDIFLKTRPWLTEPEREQLCQLLDCQKLSLEACTHATQNERLPLRVVIQVLFFEQLQLRSSIASCLLMSGNLEGSRPLLSGLVAASGKASEWSTSAGESQVLKVGMDSMSLRVSELEKDCSDMKQEIEKLGSVKSGWSSISRKLWFKTQMCGAHDGFLGDRKFSGHEGRTKVRKALD